MVAIIVYSIVYGDRVTDREKEREGDRYVDVYTLNNEFDTNFNMNALKYFQYALLSFQYPSIHACIHKEIYM